MKEKYVRYFNDEIFYKVVAETDLSYCVEVPLKYVDGIHMDKLWWDKNKCILYESNKR